VYDSTTDHEVGNESASKLGVVESYLMLDLSKVGFVALGCGWRAGGVDRCGMVRFGGHQSGAPECRTGDTRYLSRQTVTRD
jgi:hypothetical protein